jgi:predicted transcriptional regulator
MDDDVTPEELARELGYSARTIRAHLRESQSAGHLHGTPWHLTQAQAEAVRSYFQRRG